jgi:hypothetical protein
VKDGQGSDFTGQRRARQQKQGRSATNSTEHGLYCNVPSPQALRTGQDQDVDAEALCAGGQVVKPACREEATGTLTAAPLCGQPILAASRLSAAALSSSRDLSVVAARDVPVRDRLSLV